jgi:hypothetical protein
MPRRAKASTNLIARLRVWFGLQQAELALYLGVSPALVQGLEGGAAAPFRGGGYGLAAPAPASACARRPGRPATGPAGARCRRAGFPPPHLPATGGPDSQGNSANRAAGPRGWALGRRPARFAGHGGPAPSHARPRGCRPGRLAQRLADAPGPPAAASYGHTLAPAARPAHGPTGRGRRPGRRRAIGGAGPGTRRVPTATNSHFFQENSVEQA